MESVWLLTCQPKLHCPLYLGKASQNFTLVDAHGLILVDFGEVFSPAIEQRLDRDCRTPLAERAPEAPFNPDKLCHTHQTYGVLDLLSVKY